MPDTVSEYFKYIYIYIYLCDPHHVLPWRGSLEFIFFCEGDAKHTKDCKIAGKSTKLWAENGDWSWSKSQPRFDVSRPVTHSNRCPLDFNFWNGDNDQTQIKISSHGKAAMNELKSFSSWIYKHNSQLRYNLKFQPCRSYKHREHTLKVNPLK